MLPGRMSAERMDVSTFGCFQTNIGLLKKSSRTICHHCSKISLQFFGSISLLLFSVTLYNSHSNLFVNVGCCDIHILIQT